MSALQTLRNKAGLLVSVVIGFALVAFILGDFLNTNNSGPKDRVIAEIDGTKIDVDQYFAVLNKLEEDYQARSGAALQEQTRNYLRGQAWDQIVREALMADQYEELGIGVDVNGTRSITPEELKDIVMGNNVDPQIQQIFANPQTGGFDRNLAVNFLQNMDNDPKRKEIWLTIEKSLTQNQLASKYNALVNKALYVTMKESEYSAKDKNLLIKFDFAGFRYNSIPDSSVSVTDADLKEYYDSNKENFKSEASRNIEYVSFPIEPSQDDFKATQKWVADMVKDFKMSEDDALFVSSNSDQPYSDQLFADGELPQSIDSAFYYAEEGTVFGPYFEQGFYKIAKLSKRVMVSDSVKARHILVKSGDAQAIADSLRGLVTNGADFAELAKEFSEDPGSGSKGGDLGWFQYGRMVKSFNDTCFYGNIGQIYTAYSQHGIHIIEILDKSSTSEKASLAILSAEVKASTTTVNKIFGESGRFAGENSTAELFKNTVANNPALSIRTANSLKENDRSVQGLKNSRAIVKWAYEAEQGTVSEVFETDDRFIVAVLTGVTEKGHQSFESAKETIRFEVIKDKKAEQLIAKFNSAGASTVSEYASKLSTPMNSSSEVSFSATSLPGIGSDLALIGTVAGLEAGKVSTPIKGTTGVYVVSVTATNENASASAISEKMATEQSLSSTFSYGVQKTLKELADITDNRSKFE